MHVALTVKYPLYCQIVMKIEFSLQILEKYKKISDFMTVRPVGGSVVLRGLRDG